MYSNYFNSFDNEFFDKFTTTSKIIFSTYKGSFTIIISRNLAVETSYEITTLVVELHVMDLTVHTRETIVYMVKNNLFMDQNRMK